MAETMELTSTSPEPGGGILSRLTSILCGPTKYIDRRVIIPWELFQPAPHQGNSVYDDGNDIVRTC